MWLDESMGQVWNDAIKPGIEKAGYEAVRIDRKEHVNKIDDEIIAELWRARFVVADFTHGADGARGGVYYEAGFAHGRGVTVIFPAGKMLSIRYISIHANTTTSCGRPRSWTSSVIGSRSASAR